MYEWLFILCILLVILYEFYTLSCGGATAAAVEPFQTSVVLERAYVDNDPRYSNCQSLDEKRLWLYNEIRAVRYLAQDISDGMNTVIDVKKENMGYQKNYTDRCLSNLTTGCIELASVDAGVFAALPDIDIF